MRKPPFIFYIIWKCRPQLYSLLSNYHHTQSLDIRVQKNQDSAWCLWFYGFHYKSLRLAIINKIDGIPYRPSFQLRNSTQLLSLVQHLSDFYIILLLIANQFSLIEFRCWMYAWNDMPDFEIFSNSHYTNKQGNPLYHLAIPDIL